MQQFFIEDLKQPLLSTEQHNQCQKVLRMRQGDQIRLVDTQGQGGLFAFADDSLNELEFIEPLVFNEPPIQLTLIASLIRAERLEWMIQKACECGVSKIVLYSAQNGVVKDFGKRADRKMERLNSIAKEACEQSYRQYAVKVEGIINQKDLKDYKSDHNVFTDVHTAPHILSTINDISSLTAIVGPEGGYTDNERTHFIEEGFSMVSLGTSVLRAETASMATCILVNSGASIL